MYHPYIPTNGLRQTAEPQAGMLTMTLQHFIFINLSPSIQHHHPPLIKV